MAGTVVTDPDAQGLLVKLHSPCLLLTHASVSSFGFIPNLGLGVAGLILYAIPMFIFIASKSSFSPKPLTPCLTMKPVSQIGSDTDDSGTCSL